MDSNKAFLFALFWRIQECLGIESTASHEQKENVRKSLLNFLKSFDDIKIHLEQNLELENFFSEFDDELWDLIFYNNIPRSNYHLTFHKRKELAKAMIYYICFVQEDFCCEKSKHCSIDKIKRSEFENVSFEELNECFENWTSK